MFRSIGSTEMIESTITSIQTKLAYLAFIGLYAFGNSAANCFGRSYPGAGITLGQSLIFGYRAARHALGVN